MGPQDPVGRAPVLGNGRLTVGGRRDEHHVAGLSEGAPRQESGHGVAPGEPDRQRRHLQRDVGLQQPGERREVGILEGSAVAVEQLATISVIRLGDVLLPGRDFRQMSASPCKCAVARSWRRFQQFCYLGSAELHHVAQDQYRALTHGELLQGGGDREPHTLSGAKHRLWRQLVR